MKNILIKSCFLSAGSLLMLSCVNEEYDLSKEIDREVTVLKNLTVPVGTLGKVTLDEIISLEEGQELVAVDENGDYYLHLTGETFEESFPTGALNISEGDIATEPVIIHFPTFPFTANQRYDYSTLNNGSPLQTQMDIQIDSDIPGIVKDIRSMECDIEVNIAFDINSGSFYIKSGFTLEFPEDLHFTKKNADDTYFTITDGHVIALESDRKVTAGNPLNLKLKLNRISVPAGSLSSGALVLDEHIAISGDFYMNTNDFSSAPGNLSITMTPEVKITEITSIEGKVQINEQLDGTSVEISELPDFLSGTDIVLDFYNPQLSLSVINTLPVAFSLGAELVAHMDQTEESVNPFGPDTDSRLDIPAAASAGYVISRREVENQAGVQNIVVPGIAGLLKTIPDRIGVESVSVRSEGDAFITLRTDADYKVGFGYEVNVPLAFGNETDISFTYDITDLGLNLEASVKSAVLDLEILNMLPLELVLDAECIDAEGNVSQVIDLDVEGNLLAGNHLSPALNQIRIAVTNEAETFSLEGLRLLLRASVPAECAGVSLNKSQGLEIKNISLSIPDGVTIDLGEGVEE